MVTNIIFALVVIALIAGVFYWLWKLSKWLVIPIQIILFITLVVIVIKVFVNKENAEKLHKEITNSGIVEVENRVIKETTNSFKKVLTTSDKATEENKTVVADAKANATTVATQQAPKIEQAVSNNVKDWLTADLANEFLKEQREEEHTAYEFVKALEFAGDDKNLLIGIDKWASKRED